MFQSTAFVTVAKLFWVCLRAGVCVASERLCFIFPHPGRRSCVATLFLLFPSVVSLDSINFSTIFSAIC